MFVSLMIKELSPLQIGKNNMTVPVIEGERGRYTRMLGSVHSLALLGVICALAEGQP